ncbi:MAG: LarC family nickel insertion protein [Bacillota bacterium]
MKVLFIDSFSGFTLDMLLGALLQLGIEESFLQERLAKVHQGSCQINFYDTKDFSVQAKGLEVLCDAPPADYGLQQMIGLLENSGLRPSVKKLPAETFLRLSMSQARVTGLPMEEVTLKNPLPSLLLLVGIASCIERLAPDKIMLHSLPLGTGLVKENNHWLPVPTPVTAELVKGLPVKIGPVEGELLRPLEAALINVLVDEFAAPPVLTPLAIGYGKGSLALPIPHLLRVVLGSAEAPAHCMDAIALLETNIDDMNPEFYPYIMEKFLSQGARDVFLTPIIMKKGRPGTKLSVLCKPVDAKIFAESILKETSSLGVRIGYQHRMIACRETTKVDTPYGAIGLKIARLAPGEPMLRMTPEYEDCKTAAQLYGVPISQVYQQTIQAANKLEEYLP